MYYIIHKQLYMANTEYFYLTNYNEKEKLVSYKPHKKEAIRFKTCADAVLFILDAPVTIAENMMIIPEI